MVARERLSVPLTGVRHQSGRVRHYSGVPLPGPENREPVEIRAFRGSRRASVYREHVLSEQVFARMLEVGERRGLALLSSIDQHGSHELDKQTARRLAEEATSLRMSGELPELDDDLVAVCELARWCARAPDDSWMRIAGP
jgi:hypothetical protein